MLVSYFEKIISRAKFILWGGQPWLSNSQLDFQKNTQEDLDDSPHHRAQTRKKGDGAIRYNKAIGIFTMSTPPTQLPPLPGFETCLLNPWCLHLCGIYIERKETIISLVSLNSTRKLWKLLNADNGVKRKRSHSPHGQRKRSQRPAEVVPRSDKGAPKPKSRSRHSNRR